MAARVVVLAKEPAARWTTVPGAPCGGRVGQWRQRGPGTGAAAKGSQWQQRALQQNREVAREMKIGKQFRPKGGYRIYSLKYQQQFYMEPLLKCDHQHRFIGARDVDI
jgi:hypothetical protein